MGDKVKKLFILLIGFALTACVSTNVQTTTNTFAAPKNNARILLVEPDVQLGLLTTGGVVEPRADWSDTGRENLKRELKSQLGGKSYQFKPYLVNSALAPRELQIVRLHEAVGQSILSHGFNQSVLKLPTKKDVFDWTLGSGVGTLRENQDADYALFTYASGSYASSGRVVTMVVVAALFGAAMPLGQQVVFASLVDLRTGDIVWFNIAATGESDDIRGESGARSVVKSLLKDIPL